jgi:Zn-dependent protease with chaperone function
VIFLEVGVEKEEFDRRVSKHTRQIESAPGLYKVRVLAFALFGYVVYGLMILSALGLLGGMVALVVFHPSFVLIKLGLKVGVPVLVLIVAMFASLKVGGYVPQGIPIRPSDAPQFHKDLNEMRAKLKVPRLSRVLLTDEYNAAVVQRPKWGFFGTDSTLILGLPLMQALSPQDLKVVLAHELGHLSGNHSRFGGWVYRSVRTYVNLLEATGMSAVIEWFLNWYVPRLDALSFPLRRSNEYEADAAAAELNGNERAAQALANTSVRAALLGGFFEGVFKQATNTAHPPARLFHDWPQKSAGQTPEDAETALKEALEEVTSTDDTHPSLSDRVQALGVDVRVEPWPERSAAEEYFGDQYDSYVQQAGYHWSSRVALSWQQQHSLVQQKKARLSALEKERQKRLLTADEAFEYADIAEDVLPDHDALPLFQAVLELHPDHERARFSVGRLLLNRDDKAGLQYMESFENHRDPQLRLASASLLTRFHERAKDEAAAEQSLAKARKAAEAQQERQQARNEIKADDRYVPHGLDEAVLNRVTLALATVPEVKTAYLVQKAVDDEGPPIYVLAFDRKTGLFVDDKDAALLPEKINGKVELPGEQWIVPLETTGSLRKPIKSVAGAEIYTL